MPKEQFSCYEVPLIYAFNLLVFMRILHSKVTLSLFLKCAAADWMDKQ